MPDVSLNGIEFTIKGSSDDASDSIKQLQAQLDKLSKSLSGMKSVNTTSKALKDVGKSAKSASKPLGVLLSSLKRIAFYRAIRSAIKSIADAMREGMKNVYEFSKLNGGQFAQSMDLVATKSLTMKNQLGAAFAGLLRAITPAIVAAISLVTKLAQAISMLFGLFNGGQYLKANDVWTEWGDAAAGAGGKAKEALRYLAPFDELNRLPDDNKGGGGGGADIPAVGDRFTQETIGSFGELGEHISDIISEFFTNLSNKLKDVDWQQLGRDFVDSLIDFFEGVDSGGVASSISDFLGRALGSAISFADSAVARFAQRVIEKLKEALTQDADGNDEINIWDVVLNFFELSAAPSKWLYENIAEPFFGALAESLNMPTDEEWKNFGRNALQWLVDGFNEAVDEISYMFTGMDFQSFNVWLDNIAKLGKAWLDDLPAKLKNAGIKAINGFKSGFEDGLNKLISAYNSSAISDIFGKIEPVHFDLIPEVPKEELTKNYDAAKKQIEEQSKKNAPKLNVSSTIAITAKQANSWPADIRTALNAKDGTVQKTLKERIEQANPWSADLRTALNQGNQSVKKTVSNELKQANPWSADLRAALNAKTGTELKTLKTDVKNPTGNAATFGLLTGAGEKNLLVNTSITGYKITGSGIRYTDSVMDVSARIKVTGQANTPTINANIRSQTISPNAAGGAYYGGSWHSIPQYASGTSRVHGSLFLAGEAGPEVVGHIGGHTEVLNKSQMAATMYAAVRSAMSGLEMRVTGASVPTAGSVDSSMNEEVLYRAFSRALADSDLWDNTIELDGDVVYRKVVQRNRQEQRRVGLNPLLTV